jgi:hypothetical protein
MVTSGTVPAEKMFADAVSVNTLVTWLLRVVGLVLLFIGFTLLMAPAGVLADVIPFLGSIVLAVLAGGAIIAAGIIYVGRARAAKAPPVVPAGAAPAGPAAGTAPGKVAW